MNRKKIIISIFAIFIISFLYISIRISSIKLFEAESEEVLSISLPLDEIKVSVQYIPSNSISNDYIQVRLYSDDTEEIIGNFECYNCVISSELKGDSVFFLVLRKTNLITASTDTFRIYLKKNTQQSYASD